MEGFTDIQAPFSTMLMDNSQNRGGAFACTFCPYSTKFATTLKRHISTHTGERPYGCMVCGKRFIQRNTLQRHIKCHSLSYDY
ncbi:Zinc finger and BTB domain-containing protein 8B, partial [Stegodyphus mimosarum]